MYNNGYPQPSPAVPAAAAAAAYGNYGAYSANPVSYPQQAIQPTNTASQYSTTQQYAYPTAAAAYAQYGQTAAQQQQQTPSNQAAAATAAAGFGTQLDYSSTGNYAENYGYSADYSNMFKNSNAGAYGSIGTASNAHQNQSGGVSLSASNSTALGGGSGVKPNNSSHYAGYEAAVYAAASSYLQAKNTGQSNKWMKTGRGGGGAGAGTFQKKRYGLGHANREVQNIYCEVCKISCAGQQTYNEHVQGKAHKKKDALSKGENKQSLPRNKVSFKCEICDVICSGRDTYDAHAKGSKHNKTVALLRKMNKPVALEPTVIPPKDGGAAISAHGAPPKKVVGVTGTKFVAGSKLSTTNSGSEEKSANNNNAVEQALLAESNVKPVGEEFIEDMRDAAGKLLQYNCKLCDCKFSDPNAKEIHLKGRRHRLQYKQKVNPELQVEFKTSQWRERKLEPKPRKDYYSQQNMYRQQMMGPPAHMRPYMNHLSASGYFETSDDRHVKAKDEAIRPNQSEIEAIEALVSLIEKSLKGISDSLAEEAKKAVKPSLPATTENGDAKTPAAVEEPERLLKGVMRVGLLAKKILLNTDKEVELVVLCSKIPTYSLLSKITEQFSKYAETAETDALKVVERKEESCFFVSFSKTQVTCRVTLTSVLVREAVKLADGTTAIESPTPDALPIKSCLSALAELRRAKWFQAMELLTEKTLISIAIPLSAGDAVRRIFETIAGGVILHKNALLKDPCEKETVDVLSNIGDQEREDITSSAQHALRLIAFRQIYKILNIERIPDQRPPAAQNAADRKRARESNGIEDDQCSDVKKEKKEAPIQPLAAV